jgi:RNA polymerase sigma-70 factor (ECF subfamily)
MRNGFSVTIADSEGGVPAVGAAMAERLAPLAMMEEREFRTFYEECAPKLRSYLRRVAGDATLADDILQETFLRLLRGQLPVMEPVQMKAYLYRTANSVLTDHWRKLKRERRWSLENFFGEKRVAHTADGGDTLRLFMSLKENERMLLWLAYVEGFDHREVALAMQLSEGSVRVLLFRARKKLAALLAAQGISGGGGESRGKL